MCVVCGKQEKTKEKGKEMERHLPESAEVIQTIKAAGCMIVLLQQKKLNSLTKAKSILLTNNSFCNLFKSKQPYSRSNACMYPHTIQCIANYARA